MKHMRCRITLSGTTMAAIILLVSVLGIFAESYAKDKKFGELKYNPNVVPTFGSAAPLPKDMDIYFSGPADRPYAVIGIKKDVPFDPNIWQAISEDAENIEKWRHMIQNYNDMLARPYFGYDILDPDGNVIGKWLSYERDTVVKMTKDNKITVYTPMGPRRFGDDPQRIGP